MEKKYKIDSETRIGHVHLTVSDIDRALKFYRDILGFEVTQFWPDKTAVFLSAGGYHHHIGLNIWQGKNVKPAPKGHTGLYHFAILYKNRKELSKVLKRILKKKYPIDGTADHGVSEAIYLRDPDGNGIELYFDKPRGKWPFDEKGKLKMWTKALDMNSLLSETK